MNQRFCAVESRAIDDPLVGSGAHLERNLLLSWPRPKWQRNLRQASDMPEALLAALHALPDEGRRVNLIHRREQPERHHRVFLMPERQAFDVPREALVDFIAALRRGDDLTAWRPEPVDRSLVLCCTHGKKDKCCAKFGFATYKAMAEAVRHHDLPFDVWESTHLGGCRLAASALVLPQLRKYGRIGDDDILPLLESEARGRPYLPCYRGDSRLTPRRQCAQVAALEWLSAQGLEADIEVDDAEETDAPHHEVAVKWQAAHRQGWLTVTCHALELLRYDTCSDLADGPSPSRVWRAVEVRESTPTPA
ncbi:sucrase ferredoxin [Halomonas elongata]|uniref:Ferredoxin domain protein n=1 Tax=Halomonas elongata (strain ATCC 33173 / DSM 2581 / NBRC 15536 / NCIMB 2198 / 1H9) TaxID=768066 RepID=E1V652_HALED|nr:sucrase ferredoxin [Halomonas elongata]WBF16979.1 sucrase ferredoxin [Halomonas elongata]WPU45810.1 sucrase ferredoxin [Halomonas elongata DSM 2581]CBV43222.1 ferredoxin domain protein [Halomonas elongata DSM 2581]